MSDKVREYVQVLNRYLFVEKANTDKNQKNHWRFWGKERIDRQGYSADQQLELDLENHLDNLWRTSSKELSDAYRFPSDIELKPTPECAEYLLQELRSDNWVNRESAAHSLGNLQIEETKPSLIKTALSDEDADVRISAIYSLYLWGGKDAEDALQQALKDSDASVREAAQFAIKLLAAR